MHPARIFIVDDHPLVRSGFHRLIAAEPGLSVCCEAGSLAEALEQLGAHEPDLAIVDVSLPDGSGLELIKRMRGRTPHMRVLVASMHDEDLLAERALRAGAMGYINKQEAAEQVIGAIQQILAGHVYVSSRVTERLLRGVTGKAETVQTSAVECLSNRELEVFEFIGRGLGTVDIAEKLHLSVKTIETYRANIKKKLRLTSAAELSRSAIHWSLEGHSPAVRRSLDHVQRSESILRTGPGRVGGPRR
jgi:DNA-binding NarL/FixJ family response regulator